MTALKPSFAAPPLTNPPPWFASLLAAAAPRAKSLTMTVFGDGLVPRGGRVYLGSLIDLLALCGIGERLTRTSVFRLAEEGWIIGERQGRRSQYRLTAQGEDRVQAAMKLVYHQTRPAWDGRWRLVMILDAAWIGQAGAGQAGAGQAGAGMAGIAVLEPPTRMKLRKELLWAGFAPIAANLFAHPARKIAAVQNLIAECQASGQVMVMEASDAPFAGAHNLARPMAQTLVAAWDLPPVAASYQDFIRRYEPLAAAAQRGYDGTSELALALRLLLIHDWRRLVLHDPQLPRELLPADWPQSQAYEICRALYLGLLPPSEQALENILRREDAGLGDPRPAYQARFRD
ncbi:MAG: PaaX family transcriptional regulator C-terminal domain-containing protein [Candidatus Symbiobacter sp.]|nr:PaaX family transcriptional regulator C-terminal domain-containing protein [Candidatus Symbiobacter sp.]